MISEKRRADRVAKWPRDTLSWRPSVAYLELVHCDSKPVVSEVYAVEAPGLGMIKFGFSGFAARRLLELQTACPIRLKPLAIIRGNRDFEQWIHARLGGHRAHGEWFRDCPEVRHVVREMRRYQSPKVLEHAERRLSIFFNENPDALQEGE